MISDAYVDAIVQAAQRDASIARVLRSLRARRRRRAGALELVGAHLRTAPRPPTCWSACGRCGEDAVARQMPSGSARRGEVARRLAAAVGDLDRLARRRRAHALRLPERSSPRRLDRRLPAPAVAAGGGAGPGARHAAGLRQARPPARADGDRVHRPDALPRRAAVPAAAYWAATTLSSPNVLLLVLLAALALLATIDPWYRRSCARGRGSATSSSWSRCSAP